MSLLTIEFPRTLPAGLEELGDEPVFDPTVHLQLEPSLNKWRLDEFGYCAAEIAECPSDIAVAGPFRILSDEGGAVMLQSARRLETFKQHTKTLAPSVRFPAYRSRFMRDLARSPEVTAFVGEQIEGGVVPHSLTGLALTHLNYTSEEVGVAIDRWHNDAVGVACVMAASDPTLLDGGRFEFFIGTKTEAAELNRIGNPIAPQRTVSIQFPGIGWAMVQQGHLVLHRAAPLNKLSERTTFIICYCASDPSLPDVNALLPYTSMDPAHIVYPEWVRHKAWLARGRIDRLLAELPFTDDRQALIHALEQVRVELDTAIDDLRDERVGDFSRLDEL